MLQEHIEQVDSEIRRSIEQSSEGKILTSIPGIGSIQAAAIIAAMGNVLNFERASRLKAYFGWAPQEERSGTSLDRVHLTHGGTRSMKQMLFLCVASAIQLHSERARRSKRLVPKNCPHHERTQT